MIDVASYTNGNASHASSCSIDEEKALNNALKWSSLQLQKLVHEKRLLIYIYIYIFIYIYIYIHATDYIRLNTNFEPNHHQDLSSTKSCLR